MSERFWKKVREQLYGSDLSRAVKVETGALARAAEQAVDPAFVARLGSLRNSPQRALRLGSLQEGPLTGEDLLVGSEDLLTSLLVLGASGSGKTYFSLLQLLSLLARKTVDAAVVLDMKGELAELLTEVALPALAASLPTQEARALLDRLVIVNPFSPQHLPPLNVLVRDPGLPVEIQARDVAECFETATQVDVTARMETLLDWVLRLVIEVGGSFVTVRRALQEPAVLEGLTRLAQDQDVIRYFVTRYPTEPKASRLALLSRLDRFLALPMTRLCLGATHCLDFDRLLTDRITIVNLGGAPAGLQSVARFFASAVFTRFFRAVYRRSPRQQGGHAVLLADEWQVALTSALAAEFSDLLALSRSRNVHLWLANQQLAQLDRYGAGLRAIVLGQTATQAVFRMAPEDARSLRPLFPATGAMRRAGGIVGNHAPPFLSASEEVEARMNAASRLPNRIGYWSDRRKPWGAVVFRSATLALPDPSSLPRDYLDSARRGAVAFTVPELERMLVDENARLDRLAAGPTRVAPTSGPTPTSAPLTAPPAPPSAVTPSSPRPRSPKGRRGPPRI